MLNKIKKVLAIVALGCMLLFVIAVIALMVRRELATRPIWVIAPMTGFLVFGLTALLINHLQERAKKQREKEKEN